MNHEYRINADWKRLADQIVMSNQRVLVLGASDTGKSTFCRYLIDCGRAVSLKVALVDADIGQSQIGPPTTVGMQLYDSSQKTDTSQSAEDNSDVNLIEDILEKNDKEKALVQNADAIYFVGAISPQRSLLPLLTGTRLMVDSALNLGAEFIVIDTTGYVHNDTAAMLKQQKIDLIRPDHVVCIGRSKDLERIIGCYRSLNWLTIHYLLPHKSVRIKSSEARKRNRGAKFKRYFEDSKLHRMPFEQIRGARTSFFNGRLANQKELEFLSGLTENDVVYAEWGQRSVNLIGRRKLTQDATKKLRDYLSLTYVASETTSYFDKRLVGMLNDFGVTVAIGIIEAIDYNNKEFQVRCKTGIVSDVKVLQFGEYRLTEKQ